MIKKWKLRRSSVDLSGSNSDFSKLYDGIDTCFDFAKVHFFWRIFDDFRKVYEIRHIIYHNHNDASYEILHRKYKISALG